MTSNPDERRDLSGEDQQFVERLASHFAPPLMTVAQRVAFDKALDTRLAMRQRQKMFVPAFATVAVAAAVVWLSVSGLFTSLPAGGGKPETLVAEARTEAQWEYELLSLNAPIDSAPQDEPELLPDDYRAIASVFLDGERHQ